MPRSRPAAGSKAFKMDVWRSLMEVHNAVLHEIEGALADRHRLSVSEFDTLANIPREGTRLRELKDRVVLSQSAVSRLCDRLEERGYITRTPVEEDMRGASIRLTEAGRKLQRGALRTNAEVVERALTDRLSEAQLASLREILDRLRTPDPPESGDTPR
jgi:DNA-binding MarR family transcriptional regulator